MVLITMMTKREGEIYRYIVMFNNLHDRMPTSKEIQYDCRIGRGSLQRILGSLTAMNKLKPSVSSQIAYKLVRSAVDNQVKAV